MLSVSPVQGAKGTAVSSAEMHRDVDALFPSLRRLKSPPELQCLRSLRRHPELIRVGGTKYGYKVLG